MSGGVFIRVAAGRPGAGAAHLRYITRPSAMERDGHELRARHLPAYALVGRTDDERRGSLIAYAEQREDWERRRSGGGGGGPARTHYRLILSCETRIANERMQALVGRYLDRQFPEARTVSVVHQDTARTHAHVWVDARAIDGRQLHFDAGAYRRLDEAWAHEYARAFAPDAEREHLAKKAETHAWRAAATSARVEGRPPPPRPPRDTRRPRAADRRREEGARRDDPARAGAVPPVTASRAVERLSRAAGLAALALDAGRGHPAADPVSPERRGRDRRDAPDRDDDRGPAR